MRDEIGLRRQWILLHALGSRRLGLSIRQMAVELGVTQRTIRRDLDLFRGVGFPLEETVGEFGRKTWKLKSGRDLPQLAFSFDEAFALYLGRRLLEPLAGTPFGDAARHAFQKIGAVLGPTALDYIEHFSTAFHETGHGFRDYASKSELIEGLQVAIEEGKEVRLLYRSENNPEATHRDVHPCGMVFHLGALYLIAFVPRDDKIKQYKLDRIEDVEVGRAAPRPEKFDLKAYMASAFGVFQSGDPIDVEVRFAPCVARYVQEVKRHESQKLVPQADGAILATFTVSGTEEIKHWILSFGAKAEVLRPEELRREVINELRAMLAAYSGTPDD